MIIINIFFYDLSLSFRVGVINYIQPFKIKKKNNKKLKKKRGFIFYII